MRYDRHNATTLLGLGKFVCIHPNQTVHSYHVHHTSKRLSQIAFNLLQRDSLKCRSEFNHADAWWLRHTVLARAKVAEPTDKDLASSTTGKKESKKQAASRSCLLHRAQAARSPTWAETRFPGAVFVCGAVSIVKPHCVWLRVNFARSPLFRTLCCGMLLFQGGLRSNTHTEKKKLLLN